MQKSIIEKYDCQYKQVNLSKKNSFATSVILENYPTLKNSRIQNLPEHIKIDLHDKIPFIVVFQCIEIQRLSLQIQALRIQFKDNSRQFNNYSSYQIQIRQLSQKCCLYQKQREQYRQQVQKLNKICQHLFHQLEIIKTHYQDTTQTNYNNIQSQNHSLRDQLKNQQIIFKQLQQQNRQNSRMATKCKDYQILLDQSGSQIERLNNLIDEKINQLNYYKQKTIELEQNYKNNQYKYPSIDQKYRKLQENYNLIKQELQNQKQNKQILRNKYIVLQRLINNYKIIQRQKISIQQQLKFQLKINDNYQIKIKYLQQATSYIHQLQNQLKNQQIKKIDALKQVQRLNNIIQVKTKQQQHYLKKIFNLQKQLHYLKNIQKLLQQYKDQNQKINNQLNRINTTLLKKSQQISFLKEEFSRRNKQIDLMSKQQIIYQQNLKDTLQKLTLAHKQSDQYHQKYMNIDQQLSKIKSQSFFQKESYSHQKNLLNYEMDELKRLMIDKDKQITRLKTVEAYSNELHDKVRAAEDSAQESQNKYKRQYYRAQDLNRIVNNLRSDIDRIKRDGYYPSLFHHQFIQLKKHCQLKQRQHFQLMKRIKTMQGIFLYLKKQLQKYTKMTIKNKQKWAYMVNNLQDYSLYVNKTISNQQKQLQKLSQENISLQSSTRLMNFQLNQSNLTKSYIQPSTQLCSFDVLSNNGSKWNQLELKSHGFISPRGINQIENLKTKRNNNQQWLKYQEVRRSSIIQTINYHH